MVEITIYLTEEELELLQKAVDTVNRDESLNITIQDFILGVALEAVV